MHGTLSRTRGECTSEAGSKHRSLFFCWNNLSHKAPTSCSLPCFHSCPAWVRFYVPKLGPIGQHNHSPLFNHLELKGRGSSPNAQAIACTMCGLAGATGKRKGGRGRDAIVKSAPRSKRPINKRLDRQHSTRSARLSRAHVASCTRKMARRPYWRSYAAIRHEGPKTRGSFIRILFRSPLTAIRFAEFYSAVASRGASPAICNSKCRAPCGFGTHPLN